MDWIREIDNGLVFSVRAVPRAVKNEIQGVHGDALKVRLQAPPVEGKANQALIRFLSDTLCVARAQIEIRSGETGRNKTICIHGLSKAELLRRLAL